MDEFLLANEFPAKSEADWCALVDKALAGTSFDTLRANLYSGFKTEPLYTARSVTDRAFSVLKVRSREIIQPIRDDGISTPNRNSSTICRATPNLSGWKARPKEKTESSASPLATYCTTSKTYSARIYPAKFLVHLGGGNGYSPRGLFFVGIRNCEKEGLAADPCASPSDQYSYRRRNSGGACRYICRFSRCRLLCNEQISSHNAIPAQRPCMARSWRLRDAGTWLYACGRRLLLASAHRSRNA